MEVEIKSGARFTVDIKDGKLKVYPTPISEEQLAEVRDKAIEMYRANIDTLASVATTEEDAKQALVAVSVNNFMRQIRKIQQDEQTVDGTPYSFSVTFSGDTPRIDIYLWDKDADEHYRNVLQESLYIYRTALGYDVGGPMKWGVKHIKYHDKDEETIYSRFDNDADTVNTIRDFVNSYCRLGNL